MEDREKYALSLGGIRVETEVKQSKVEYNRVEYSRIE